MKDSEILKQLLESKKITENDIKELKQSPEDMMKLTALFHTLLCPKEHPTTCSFEEDHLKAFAWESKSHEAWLDFTITICQWINNGANFATDEISLALSQAKLIISANSEMAVRTVALLTLGLSCVADEESLSSLWFDIAPQPSEPDELES